MSSMTETLGRGRLQTPRWLAIAILVMTVAIIVTAVVRIANQPTPTLIGDRRPSVVYPASGRDAYHDGLVIRAARHWNHRLGEI